MVALYRFYSVLGRISVMRFVCVAAITTIILFAVLQIEWQSGLALNILAGAIGGTAFAKLLVESIRRLRAAGISRQIAAWTTLAMGIASMVTLYAIMTRDPPWAQILLDAICYCASIACVVALLWPTRSDAHEENAPYGERTGLAIAIICMVIGALAMGSIAWLSNGMNANNHRNAVLQDARDHASRLPLIASNHAICLALA